MGVFHAHPNAGESIIRPRVSNFRATQSFIVVSGGAAGGMGCRSTPQRRLGARGACIACAAQIASFVALPRPMLLEKPLVRNLPI